MRLDDSVSVDVEAKVLFKDQPLPPNVKPEDKLTFIFCVKDVTDQSGVMKIQQELQAKQMEQNRKTDGDQLTLDTVAIDAHLAASKVKAVKHPSGLRYVIKKMGKGPAPTLSSIVIVNYRGTLMDNGRVFDQSKLEYPLTQLVKGWQIGFQLLPKGTSAILYVPSTLGYGANGYPPDIPPNANLVFEVELIDFKN